MSNVLSSGNAGQGVEDLAAVKLLIYKYHVQSLAVPGMDELKLRLSDILLSII